GSMPGFQAGLQFDDDGDAVIMLCNTTAGLSGTLLTTLWQLLGDHAPRDPEVWTADGTQADLVELTGTWYWGPAEFELSAARDGGLVLRPHGNGRGSRFRPLGQDRWLGLDGYYRGEELRPVRVDGRVSHWDLASFRLTRTPYDPDADLPGGVTGAWSLHLRAQSGDGPDAPLRVVPGFSRRTDEANRSHAVRDHRRTVR